MSAGSKTRKGFSLIEALVAAAIAAIGLTAALGSMASLSRAEGQAHQIEVSSRLAHSKYDEVVATEQYLSAPIEGDFEEMGFPGYSFRLETEPSGVENLQVIRVTVRPPNTDEDGPSYTATGLIYQAPEIVEGLQ